MKKAITSTMVQEVQEIHELTEKLKSILLQMKDAGNAPEIMQQLKSEAANLQSEIRKKQQSNDECRRDLIKRIEAITSRPMLTFFSELHLENDDVEMIEDILRSIDLSVGFDLLINSPGGYPDAAEKMIHVCRHYAGCERGHDWNVIVVGRAKSAATMVALGATRILMTPTAELGPIDPQIRVFLPSGVPEFISAHQIKHGYERYLDEIKEQDATANPCLQIYAHMAAKYDPQVLEYARTALLLTEEIAQKRLTVSGQDLELFKDPEKTCSHGRGIFLKDIADKPFASDVCKHYNNAEIEPLLWELFVRSNAVSSAKEITAISDKHLAPWKRKLYETSGETLMRTRIVSV